MALFQKKKLTGRDNITSLKNLAETVSVGSNTDIYAVFPKSISALNYDLRGCYSVENSQKVSFRNLIFNGNRPSFETSITNDPLTSGVGVYIKESSDVIIEDSVFRNFRGAGIYIDKSENIKIKNSRFENCRVGVEIYGVSGVVKHVLIENCEFIGNMGGVISNLLRIYNAEWVEIRNCSFTGAGLPYGPSDASFGTWGNGIFMWNVKNVYISNVKSYNNYWSGIVVGQGSLDVFVSNSYFSASAISSPSIPTTTACWIEMAGCRRVVFSANRFSGGIAIGDTGGQEVIISSNYIEGIDYGIDLNEEGYNVIIQGNIINRISGGSYLESRGIHVWQRTSSTKNTIIANNIIMNYVMGILVNNLGGTGNAYALTVIGNRVSGCTYPFTLGGDVQLVNSQIVGNSFNSYYRWYNPNYVTGPHSF